MSETRPQTEPASAPISGRPALLRFRADVAWRYLRAAPQGGVRLGHRRLLLHRHHAGRGDADHRHGGDERFSRRTAGHASSASTGTSSSQPIDTPLNDYAAVAAAHRAGARRQITPFPSSKGQVLVPMAAATGDRRAGARHPRRGPATLPIIVQEHQGRRPRRLCRGEGVRSAAGWPTISA